MNEQKTATVPIAGSVNNNGTAVRCRTVLGDGHRRTLKQWKTEQLTLSELEFEWIRQVREGQDEGREGAADGQAGGIDREKHDRESCASIITPIGRRVFL